MKQIRATHVQWEQMRKLRKQERVEAVDYCDGYIIIERVSDDGTKMRGKISPSGRVIMDASA